jgi:hypothetical protein
MNVVAVLKAWRHIIDQVISALAQNWQINPMAFDSSESASEVRKDETGANTSMKIPGDWRVSHPCPAAPENGPGSGGEDVVDASISPPCRELEYDYSNPYAQPSTVLPEIRVEDQ